MLTVVHSDKPLNTTAQPFGSGNDPIGRESSSADVQERGSLSAIAVRSWLAWLISAFGIVGPAALGFGIGHVTAKWKES